MVRFANPHAIWEPFGPFSQVALIGDGQIVHIKGQVPLDRHKTIVGRGDMRRQLEQVLLNIQTALNSLGGDMSDVVSLTSYCIDINAFMAAGDVRSSYFEAPYPTTTTIEVKALYHPDVLVEITAIAEIPRERFREPVPGTQESD